MSKNDKYSIEVFNSDKNYWSSLRLTLTVDRYVFNGDFKVSLPEFNKLTEIEIQGLFKLFSHLKSVDDVQTN